MVEGVRLLVALIGRLGRRGAELVGMLYEVQAAVEHKFGPPKVQCKSRAPPALLELDGLARPVVDVDELEIPNGELRGDRVGDDVQFAGQLRARVGFEAHGLP